MLTEITGYHYWMCKNSSCPSSYKYRRAAAQQSVQRTGLDADEPTEENKQRMRENSVTTLNLPRR